MPIYNNIEYLSLPEQVQKNKDDIAALQAIIEVLQATIQDLTDRIEALE